MSGISKIQDLTIKKIALFSGNGDLPRTLIDAFKKQNIPYHLIGFYGLTDEVTVHGHPHDYHGIGEVGAIIQTLKQEGVTHIMLAGTLRRPSFSEVKVDVIGAKWLARLGMSMFSGDDTLLKKLIHMMEEEGFFILSPQEILNDVFFARGVHTHIKPSQEAFVDIERGISVLRALDAMDVGQAVVVQQGIVLGIEAAEGTAALIHRIMDHKREGGFGGVLVKLAKTTQTHKADLPTIGPETVKQMEKAGLAGIAISAGLTQVLAKDDVIKALDKAGLFLVALAPDFSPNDLKGLV